jgi:hypothetical protein
MLSAGAWVMNFYSGQKVVCVDAKERLNGPTHLALNGIYTVLKSSIFWGVVLLEVDCFPSTGFHNDRFRPVLLKTTDISIFEQKPILEDA